MTCNNANVPDGLLICLGVALAVAIVLGSGGVFIIRLLVRRRASFAWLAAFALAIVVEAFCVWQMVETWTLRVGLQTGVTGGKGVCQVFWSQQLNIGFCAIVTGLLAVLIGVRAIRRSFRGVARA